MTNFGLVKVIKKISWNSHTLINITSVSKFKLQPLKCLAQIVQLELVPKVKTKYIYVIRN